MKQTIMTALLTIFLVIETEVLNLILHAHGESLALLCISQMVPSFFLSFFLSFFPSFLPSFLPCFTFVRKQFPPFFFAAVVLE